MGMRIGSETGSVTNHIMSYNDTKPEVGKGATVMGWTDRYAYEVESVTADGKSCVVFELNAKRTDSNGMSEMQEYEYSRPENPHFQTLVYKWKHWRIKKDDGTFPKIQILFGVRRKYYDFSF